MDEGESPPDGAPEQDREDVERRYIVDLDEEPATVAAVDQDRQTAIDAVRTGDCVSVSWFHEPDEPDSSIGSTHWLISPIELAPSLILFVMAKAWVDFKSLTGADDGEIARALRAALDEGVGQ